MQLNVQKKPIINQMILLKNISNKHKQDEQFILLYCIHLQYI